MGTEVTNEYNSKLVKPDSHIGHIGRMAIYDFPQNLLPRGIQFRPWEGRHCSCGAQKKK